MNHQEEIENMIKNSDLQKAIIVRNQLAKGLINREEATKRIAKY
jgi:hypothetical protein